MPVNVPDEPKRYTTVYDNFRGVDFTDDASNIYKRRSPSAVNMLPDLDGRPYKRTGWDIKFSAQDFITASGAVGVTEITPLRTHYFSYGGHDFIMVFNSLGVFWIRDDSDAPVLAQLWENNSETPFPPFAMRQYEGEQEPREVQLTADHNRAFFFEGQGISGFYVFVEDDLYRFCEVGGGFYFVKTDPTVPIIIIGAVPRTHVGTDYQAFNMLTDKRTIEYFGDGTALYTIPSEVASSADVKVEILDPDTGVWKVIPPNHATYPWSLQDKYKIVFSSGKPAASTVGNVRITYTPENNVYHSIVPGAETKKVKYTITQTITQRQTRKIEYSYEYNAKKKKWVFVEKWVYPNSTSAWTEISRTKTSAAVKLNFPDVFKFDNVKIMCSYPSGTYTDMTSKFTKTYKAYSSSAEVKTTDKFRDEVISAATKKTSSPTSWINSKTLAVYKDSISAWKTTVYQQSRTRTITCTRSFYIYGVYDRSVDTWLEPSLALSREAFAQCRKTLNYGNDIYNQVFISASSSENYRNRAWYCAANDPSYFPETNYIEVGSDDKSIMGLQKVGSYLGFIKMGSGTEASVYLAYPTSFEEDSTYAVKQSVSGIGAISTGAFNILNEEPLFLSEHGVMGINVNETDTMKRIRNRSFYINKRLTAEPNLENAISFVHGGLYYLAINGHCYVLDGSQKSSWANEKTNLQYECYYLDNVPAQCFAKLGTYLYFSDERGNLCFFKKKEDVLPYVDNYFLGEAEWISSAPPDGNKFDLAYLAGASAEMGYLISSEDDVLCVAPNTTVNYDPAETYAVDDYARYEGNVYICIESIDTPEEWTEDHWSIVEPDRLQVMSGQAGINGTVSYGGLFYTITDVDEENGWAIVSDGVPVYAEWSTIADDDGMVHFFKNLAKKGCVVSILPGEGYYIQVLIKPDEKAPVDIGYINSGMTELPSDVIVKKKIKKYKRLQFIIRDGWYNDGFALDQIIKTYTVGNYSKNRK